MDTQRAYSATPLIADEIMVGDRSTARALREARLFLRLARFTGTASAFEELLARVFELVNDVMPVDRISIAQTDGLGNERVWMHPPCDTPDETAFVLEVAHRVIKASARSQEIVKSELLDANALGAANAPSYIQSAIAVPLLQEAGAGDALIVSSYRIDGMFSEQDQEIVSAAGRHLALMIERERAVQEARRRTDQMAAFSAITSTVNEWVDVEQLARRFLSVLLNITQTNRGLFYLREDRDTLRLLSHFGISDEVAAPLRTLALALHPEPQRVLETGRVLVLEASSAGRENARDLVGALRVSSLVFFPLRAKGRAIGAVALGKSEGALGSLDREFLLGLADQTAQAIENARLFAESERRFKEQSALRELAQRFLSAVSPDEVLERTLDALINLLPGDFSEILLPDSEGALTLANGRGWRRGIAGRTRTVSDPHMHAGYVLRAQSPVIIENFATETRFQPSDYLMRHQVVAGVCAPMLAETRVIGMLGVYSRNPRQFTEEQSHFLYLVATQTAIALEKARHSQAAARRLDELILLNDVIIAANSEVSLERMLSTATYEIGELLHSNDVHMSLLSRGNSEAVPSGTEESDWGAAVRDWVIKHGQPLLIPDLLRDLRFNQYAASARSCLSAPMMISDQVIGVIAIAHAEPNALDANDLRLLTTLAGQIAAAIERARLLDETRRQLAEISAVFEFSNALRTATSESHLLELVVRDAASMLRASESSVQLLNDAGDEIQVRAAFNMKHVGMAVPRELGGLSWEAFVSGETFAVSDVMTDARVNIPEVFENVHGAIVAPLRTPSGVLGSLFVGFQERDTPNQERIRLATTIANLAAQALHRLRLNEQTVEQAATLVVALNDLEQSYQATLLALSAALDARDHETEGHSQRVTRWALAIGQKLNLSAQELTNLERGALLHDVGKIGISDNILLKPGPLTAEDRLVMNRHPQLGYEMLHGIPFLQDALPVVLYHQEKYDGTGYPMKLRGEEIPLCARVFAVADAYDAMTSTRPYRKALAHDVALAEIVACSGTQFDPRVVQVFINLFQDSSPE